jgi:hypothetical protein
MERRVILLVLLAAVSGCMRPEGGAGPQPDLNPVIPVPEARKVVDEYLHAAAAGDGDRMYALIASSERKNETPRTLTDTARDRYKPGMTWDVLKTDQGDSSGTVVAEFKGADVEPNPYRFTLTRENGEWRIVQSPELHEEDKPGRIKIEL